MFIIVTLVTLLAIFTVGGLQSRPSEAAYTLFLPLGWLSLVIYILWGVALLNSFINPIKRFSVLQYIGKIGVNANMQILNVLLLCGTFLLISVGWKIANTNMVVTGIIVGLGLLGNGWEQRSII